MSSCENEWLPEKHQCFYQSGNIKLHKIYTQHTKCEISNVCFRYMRNLDILFTS